jgi:hypothetical protein
MSFEYVTIASFFGEELETLISDVDVIALSFVEER